MNAKRILYETIPVLILCGLVELLAGANLSRMDSLLESLPGLLIMVPPMLDLRGDINGAFAARLSSGIHLGVIDFKRRGEIWENLKAVLFLSVVVPTLIALFSYSVCYLLSMPSITLPELLFIAVCTGLVSSMIMSVLSVAITYASVRRGIDPDNVAIPLLATLGDFVVVILLFVFAMVIA